MLRFFEENNISLYLTDLKMLEQCKSEMSTIELYEHQVLGKILVINNEIQHIEAWQSLYHESLVHIPASFIPEVKTVLLLGGGSFFAAREILKYKSLKKLTMVDYDKDVIQIVTNNYSHVEEIISDKRYLLVTENIFDFLQFNKNKYDLIINDAFDILKYGDKVFSLLVNHLTKDGVCGDVVYRHIFEKDLARNTIISLRKEFKCAFSLLTIPEYPGVLHLLSIWAKSKLINQKIQKVVNREQLKWGATNSIPCQIYNPNFIKYYMHIPPYLKKWVTEI